MTRKDYTRHRNYLATKRDEFAPRNGPSEMDELLRDYGYPAKAGTWARLMINGVPTKHLVITLAQAWRVDPYVIMPKVWFSDLDDCRARTCPEHGS